MGVIKGLCALVNHADDLGYRQQVVLRAIGLQGLPAPDVLHNDIGLAVVGLAGVVNAQNVGIVQRAR